MLDKIQDSFGKHEAIKSAQKLTHKNDWRQHSPKNKPLLAIPTLFLAHTPSAYPPMKSRNGVSFPSRQCCAKSASALARNVHAYL